MRILTRREFLKVNKEIDFDDLKVGMELTIDDTDEPGWYEVVSVRNWNSMSEDFVELELIETVEFTEIRDVLDNLEYDLNDLVSNIRYHIGDIEALGVAVLKRDDLLNLINNHIDANLTILKDILKADYYKSMGLTNKEIKK